jgi:hypothetical protein
MAKALKASEVFMRGKWVILLCCVWVLGCGDKTPKPPVDLGQVKLADAIKFSDPCYAKLAPAWEGESRIAIRTGSFLTPAGDMGPDVTQLRFDLFSNGDPIQSAQWGRGSRSIQDKKGQWFLMDSLPSDEKIKGLKKREDFEKLFGNNQQNTDAWGRPGEMHTTAGWSSFAMVDDRTIETLDIFVFITSTPKDGQVVDSIFARRGRAHPHQ